MTVKNLGARHGRTKRIRREGGRRLNLPSRRVPFLPVVVLLSLLCFSVAHPQDDAASSASSGSSGSPSVSPNESVEPLPPSAVSEADGEEDAVSTDRPYWRQNLFGRFFRDQKYLFSAWWPSEVRLPGFTMPLLAGTILATSSYRGDGEQQDLQLGRYIKNEVRGRGEGPAQAFSFIGDAGSGAFLVGSGYLIGRLSHNDRLAKASSLSAEALLSAGLWSSALKTITGRPRPGGGSNGRFLNYHPGAGQTAGSFPSGHATGAFTVATVFAEVYKDHPWVSWVAYGTAGLIGTSRVALGRHFPSDVIVGGLLGNSFGRMVLAHEQESGDSRSSHLQPFVDPTQRIAGLLWTRRW